MVNKDSMGRLEESSNRPNFTSICRLTFLFLSFFPVSFLSAEVIYLKTGGKVEGKIVERAVDKVKIDVAGIVLTYYQDEIDSLDLDPQSAPLSDATIPVENIESATVIATNQENVITAEPTAVLKESSSPSVETNASAVAPEPTTSETQSQPSTQPQDSVDSPTTSLEEKKEDLTQEELKAVLDQMTQSINNKDIVALENLIWEDATFSLSEVDGVTQHEFKREDYLKMAQISWAETVQYAFQYTLNQISIDGHKAICQGIPQESISTKQGLSIVSQAQSEDIFEKRNGVIKKLSHKRIKQPAAADSSSPHSSSVDLAKQ